MTKGQKGHSVYILSCSDGSFYTGITNDLSRRLSEQGSLLPGSCRQPEAADPAFKATCFLHWLVRGTRLLMGTHNRAVLFATKSFWEGVPGEALSLVIIGRLPFAPHRDPVIQHWRQRIREAGGNSFTQYSLPEAILGLKQGVGRLIRTETDRGVMAVLDSRVNTKRYGPQVIASLPRALRTLWFEDVAAFFGEEE